jgi:hypothetical protein
MKSKLKRPGVWLLAVSGIAIVAALEAGPVLSEKVGTAAAVNPATVGKPPSGGERQLTIGAEIIHKEQISTTAQGSLQVLFVDRTALSIGPNSEITIDEFVYDPNAKTGKMAISIGKGLLRFVGGQVSHTAGATITTPSATMGIRGGIAIYNVVGGVTELIHQFGRSAVNAGGQNLTVTQSGYYVQISGPGATPSDPRPASIGQLAGWIAQLQSKPGQSGGAKGGVAKKGGKNSDDITGSIGSPKGNQNWIGNFQNYQAKGTNNVPPPSPPPTPPPPVAGGGFTTPGQIGGVPGNPSPPGLPGGPGPNPPGKK